VIGKAQLRDRPPHDLAGRCGILRNGIANFHPDIIHQASSTGNLDIMSQTGELSKVWPMYRIREADGYDDEIADTLADLHRLTFFDGASIPEFDWGYWWLAYHEKTPVAFAGLVPSARAYNAGYLCRVGVLKKHRGSRLQLRLMRALESRARHDGWSCIVSDTTDNLSSANNFIRAGYRLYQPQYPWAWPNTLYWRKSIG
jgi:GNAT superfamily N-acetyltransferase